MSANLLDADAILSGNEQWMKLEEEWIPVDLETEEDNPKKLQSVVSTLDLKKSTFDSSFLFKKIRKKVGRRLSKKSLALDYKDFIQDLQQSHRKLEESEKQFYYINGQIMSAVSVEDICDKIDDIFKSVEKLCSATSTVRDRKVKKKVLLPEIVQCSISAGDLSFDDTASEKEKSDLDDVDRFIDEAFEHLNYTIVTLSGDDLDERSKDTVTTLVRKFSSILNSPVVYCNPRRQRQCCERFKELAEFWNTRVCDNDE